MSAPPSHRFTYEEYLQRERVAPTKSEFYRGEIFAMAGGTRSHSRIGVNIVAGLDARLEGAPCRPYNSDLRIYIPAIGLGTYPDVSVVCGDEQVDPHDPDAITNPSTIFEVLSKSTERYDRGRKFAFYRQLESLREYVLVSQEEPLVERFVRQSDGSWVLTVCQGLEAVLELAAAGCSLPLSKIYKDVEFQPEDHEPRP